MKKVEKRCFINLICFISADGTQFSPGVTKKDTLYAYSPEVCR